MHIFALYIPHSVIAWVVIGLLAGWIAGTVSRGRGFGCLANIVLGLVGAVLGGWIFSQLGIVRFGFIYSLAAATLGAVILVAIARLFSGGKE
ncbi:MAG TPA: GlsB/YeaQ/YmgE family stress response membrane protein [Candidatus Acidoferrales bacterium]|nr:GlsB/YeaQ/YmgE family stress response membrane protein [Candidatus Acidoferrales bacterium]